MEPIDGVETLLRKRDLSNFIELRTCHPGDDLLVGELLVRTFRETYARKLPAILTSAERETELRNVSARRRGGLVRVLELGYQIIGTYALLYPGTPDNASWTSNTCTLRCVAVDPRFHSLRLSERLVEDAIQMAREWKAAKICLHVQAGAEGVARLYQKFAFQRSTAGDQIMSGFKIEGYVLEL